MNDPVLDKFCSALRDAYGDRIERIVLYGSRARGDAREDSDYDVAVFLYGLDDYWKEMGRIADMAIGTLDTTEGLVHPIAFPVGAWRDRTTLMHEMRREGVDL